MDYKLEYLERLFYKIKNKKTESYVISRIWHQLADDRVKFVTQQYVRIDNCRYALVDLYLPQLNIFIEINEPFHKNNVELDIIRNEKIKSITQADIEVIDCDCSIEEIHNQITGIVKQIKDKIVELGPRFIPWNDVDKLTVEYHKSKGFLLVEDNECVRTTEEIAQIFDTQAKHRGYLRVSAVKVPNRDNEHIWWPSTKHGLWSNVLSSDGLYIEESPTRKNKRYTPEKHLTEWLNKPEESRITFLRDTDELGFCFYRFVGVFRLDKEQSIISQKCIWRRVSDRYDIGRGFIHVEEVL